MILKTRRTWKKIWAPDGIWTHDPPWSCRISALTTELLETLMVCKGQFWVSTGTVITCTPSGAQINFLSSPGFYLISCYDIISSLRYSSWRLVGCILKCINVTAQCCWWVHVYQSDPKLTLAHHRVSSSSVVRASA